MNWDTRDDTLQREREGDGDITQVVAILNRESATLASPGVRQAHPQEQCGYL